MVNCNIASRLFILIMYLFFLNCNLINASNTSISHQGSGSSYIPQSLKHLGEIPSNSGLSKFDLMDLLRSQMMTHTSLRHTKRSQVPQPLERFISSNSGLRKVDLMNLLRSQMMTHTSLRHTKRSQVPLSRFRFWKRFLFPVSGRIPQISWLRYL